MKIDTNSAVNGRIVLQSKQPFFLRSNDNRTRRKMNDILERTKRKMASESDDATTLDIKSLKTSMKQAFVDFEELMRSERYFDVVPGKTDFREQLKKIQNTLKDCPVALLKCP